MTAMTKISGISRARKITIAAILVIAASLAIAGKAHASIASDPGNCHSSAQGLASSGHTCPDPNPGLGH